eukprot:6211053-Pleurochrysis_carterae.AAC.3
MDVYAFDSPARVQRHCAACGNAGICACWSRLGSLKKMKSVVTVCAGQSEGRLNVEGSIGITIGTSRA